MITMTHKQATALRTQINALVRATRDLGKDHMAYQLAFALSHTLFDIIEESEL
jgi:hypothetical protein